MWNLIHDMPMNLPLLVIATAERELSQVPEEVQELFIGGGAGDEAAVCLSQPSDARLRQFFTQFVPIALVHHLKASNKRTSINASNT